MIIEHLPNIFIIMMLVSGIVINALKRSDAKQIITSDITLSLIRVLIPLSIVISYFIPRYGHFPISDRHLSLSIFAIILFCVGIVIRYRSILLLGRYFTVDAVIQPQHRLVRTGFYKYIRHPSYTGSLIYYVAFGLALNNVFSLIISFVLPLIAIIIRIKKEEHLLENFFGKEYLQYKTTSWALFPFIY